jgi:hypothetical protein
VSSVGSAIAHDENSMASSAERRGRREDSSGGHFDDDDDARERERERERVYAGQYGQGSEDLGEFAMMQSATRHRVQGPSNHAGQDWGAQAVGLDPGDDSIEGGWVDVGRQTHGAHNVAHVSGGGDSSWGGGDAGAQAPCSARDTLQQAGRSHSASPSPGEWSRP